MLKADKAVEGTRLIERSTGGSGITASLVGGQTKIGTAVLESDTGYNIDITAERTAQGTFRLTGDKEIFNATNRLAPIKNPVEQIEEQHSDSTLAYSIQDLNTYSPIQSGSLLIL